MTDAERDNLLARYRATPFGKAVSRWCRAHDRQQDLEARLKKAASEADRLWKAKEAVELADPEGAALAAQIIEEGDRRMKEARAAYERSRTDAPSEQGGAQ